MVAQISSRHVHEVLSLTADWLELLSDGSTGDWSKLADATFV